MRIWLPSGSAIIPDKAILQIQNSGVWVPNLSMPSGSFSEISNTLPASQNIFRQDGFPTISGVTDAEHSQYMYTSISVAPEHEPGPYGLSGSGSLRFRMTYDYQINSDSIL